MFPNTRAVLTEVITTFGWRVKPSKAEESSADALEEFSSKFWIRLSKQLSKYQVNVDAYCRDGAIWMAKETITHGSNGVVTWHEPEIWVNLTDPDSFSEINKFLKDLEIE